MSEPKRKYGGYIIQEGEQFDIIAAVNSNGNSPFMEFFIKLKESTEVKLRKGVKKDKSVKDYKKLDYYFKKFSTSGNWNNKTQINKLEDGFWEFKNVDTGLRVPFYYDKTFRSVIVLTHYFVKKSQETNPGEIRRMKKIRSEFQKYRREGGYE